MREDEVRARSEVEVTATNRILTIDNVRQVNPLGLVSGRLGPVQRGESCEVCAGQIDAPYYLEPSGMHGYMCPGHFGHIELPGAVFHPQFIKVALQVISSFCWLCGWLPGRQSSIDAALERVLQRDVNGNSLSRNERLRLLWLDFKKCHKCAQCLASPEARAKQRCSQCRDAERQCSACAGVL